MPLDIEVLKDLVLEDCYTVRRIREELEAVGQDTSDLTDCDLIAAMREVLNGTSE